MRKKLVFQTIVLLLSISAFSQKFDLGKVSVEELKQAEHPKDPKAEAAILYKKGRTYFDILNGNKVVTEVEIRLKIYKKEGYDWATFVIDNYINNNLKENVAFSNAYTYNLVDGKIEKTKLKNEGIFVEKLNDYKERNKIVFPNVKELSVIEFKYVQESPFIGTLCDWSFQMGIPVNYSEYVTQIPEFFIYKSQMKGTLIPKMDKTSKGQTIQKKEKENTGYGFVTSQTSQSYQEFINTYTLKDIPAMADESYINNINNYRSAILHELMSIKYPNQPYKDYSTDWATIVRDIYLGDFGSQLGKRSYFEDDLAAILKGVTNPDEKITTVFNFVKSRMNWNEVVGYYCEKGVRTAYKEKVGNTADINLILVAMLREAGIDVNPILLSTRNNGIALLPNRNAYNYVIAGVQTAKGLVFLDATDKIATPNVLPLRALNWFGRIVRKDGTSDDVELVPTNLSKNVTNIMATIGSDGVLKGMYREQQFDYFAYLYRRAYGNIDEEKYLEKIEKEHPGLQIESYKVANKADLTKPVVEDYNFTHDGIVEKIGDKIYIDPMVFVAKTQNPFKQDKREYPIDFSFPHQEKYMINLTLPEGYVVESVPEAISMFMEEDMGSYNFNITASGNKIQLVATLDIKWSLIPATHYEGLKNFYKAMIEKETEKIVLKKA
ncbi:transglutaminase domain-containing protein [Flavobacterium sp. WV_118_3]|uniref:DUF3857 domain-containing protein n=1 Tax=Flavobacterium sp. WV_118_3 TaxID=3151764 RepID=UPI00321AF1AF